MAGVERGAFDAEIGVLKVMPAGDRAPAGRWSRLVPGVGGHPSPQWGNEAASADALLKNQSGSGSPGVLDAEVAIGDASGACPQFRVQK